MSKELQTLILAYRVVFLERELPEFRESYSASDPERLMKLAAYHAVRPVLYQALKKVDRKDVLTDRLQLFTVQMALRNKLYGKETLRLAGIFKRAGIEVLPYKGCLFTEKLYWGQHFRESGDMDIVIRDKGRAAEAVALLNGEGYVLQAEDSMEQLLENAQGREVSLIRSGNEGITFHLDFHWGVNERYNLYHIEAEDYFKGAHIQPFLGDFCLLPSVEAFFKMLLNHHGGRELWFKLKELFDFSLFLQRFSQEEYPLTEWADEVNMIKIYDRGIALNNMLISGKAEQRSGIEER